MNRDSELQQQLLELEYGLLSEEEAAQLRQRIAQDPQAAQIHEEIVRFSRMLGEAVRVEVSPIPLTKPAEMPEAEKPSAVKQARQKRGWTNRLFSIVASLLLFAAAFGYVFPWLSRSILADDHLRLAVVGPAQLKAGVPHRFEVATTDSKERPVVAQVDYALIQRNGTRLAAGTLDLPEQREFIIPATVSVSDGVTLQVAAKRRAEKETFSYQPAVIAEDVRTYLACDQSQYTAGSTVRFRSVTLARYTLTPKDGVAVEYELLGPNGQPLPGLRQSARTQQGVGHGEFVLPEEIHPGRYTLVARQPEGLFPPVRQTFHVEARPHPNLVQQLELLKERFEPGQKLLADYQAVSADGRVLAAKPIAVTATAGGRQIFSEQTLTSETGTHRIEIQLPEQIDEPNCQLSVTYLEDGGVAVHRDVPLTAGGPRLTFFPHGGKLAADLPNQMYFTAQDASGEPVEIDGTVIDQSGNVVAQAKTQAAGMGKFELTPAAGERYLLHFGEQQFLLPEVDEALPLVVHTDSVQPAGESSLAMEILSRESDVPVSVRLDCRGATVGLEDMVCRQGTNEVEIDYTAEAAGVMQLTVADSRSSNEQVLWRQFVYRPAGRRLNLDVTTSLESLQPGASVELGIQATDESGANTPAVLALSLVEESARTTRRHRSLFDQLLFFGEATSPQQWSDVSPSQSTADEAVPLLDLVLGTSSAFGTVPANIDALDADYTLLSDTSQAEAVAPTTLFDNLSTVQSGVEAKTERAVRKLRQTLAMAVFAGGVVLLLTVIALAWRSRGTFSLGTLAMVTSCLLVGAVLLMEQPRGPNFQVADATIETKPTEKAAPPQEPAADEASADRELQETAPPESSMFRTTPAAPREVPQRFQASRGVAAPGVPKELSPTPGAASPPATEQRQSARMRARPEAAQSLDRSFFGTAPQLEKAIAGGAPAGGVHGETQQQTLLWEPSLVTDSQGQATVRFALPNTIASYRLIAEAHSSSGRLGFVEKRISTRPPFELASVLPKQVHTGDKVEIPVSVHNTTNEELDVSLAVHEEYGRQLQQIPKLVARVGREQSVDNYFVFDMTGTAGARRFTVFGETSEYEDAIQSDVNVAVSGYPGRQSQAGVLQGVARVDIDVPAGVTPGTASATVRAYPSILAELNDASDSLRRQPSAPLPSLLATVESDQLALQVLRDQRIADPVTARQSLAGVEAGYQRLLTYTATQGTGFGWFAKSPPDVLLTARVLPILRQMEETLPVQPTLGERASEWLREQLPALQQSDAILPVEPAVQRAFMVLQLLQSGTDSAAVEGQIDQIAQAAADSQDPYLLALSAQCLFEADKREQAEPLLNRLQSLQNPDGRLEPASNLVSGCQGRSAVVETTATAILAWLHDPRFESNARKGADWLRRQRQGDNEFGAAPATASALTALAKWSKHEAHEPAEGTIRVVQDDRVVAESRFTAVDAFPVELALPNGLRQGDNDLLIDVFANRPVPYVVDFQYGLADPPQATDLPLELVVELSAREIALNETVTLTGKLTNTSREKLPMTTAVLALPTGLVVLDGELARLREKDAWDFCETAASEVAFYWKSLEPGQSVGWNIQLRADLAGEFVGQASRAYLQHFPEEKRWARPLQIRVRRPK